MRWRVHSLVVYESRYGGPGMLVLFVVFDSPV